MADSNVNCGMNIKFVFFKENGKYYAEDSAYIPDKNMQVYQIIDWIKENVKDYKGMHLVAMLGELKQGYPIMVPASERR